MKFENCEYTLSCPKEMITDLNDSRKYIDWSSFNMDDSFCCDNGNEYKCVFTDHLMHMITFITKNRFGVTDQFQIISEYDLSMNKHQDVAICNIAQDF